MTLKFIGDNTKKSNKNLATRQKILENRVVGRF